MLHTLRSLVFIQVSRDSCCRFVSLFFTFFKYFFPHCSNFKTCFFLLFGSVFAVCISRFDLHFMHAMRVNEIDGWDGEAQAGKQRVEPQKYEIQSVKDSEETFLLSLPNSPTTKTSRAVLELEPNRWCLHNNNNS